MYLPSSVLCPPSSGPSDACIGGIVVQDIAAPAALAPADKAEVLDQLDLADPFDHFVAELALDPQAQGPAVLQLKAWVILIQSGKSYSIAFPSGSPRLASYTESGRRPA